MRICSIVADLWQIKNNKRKKAIWYFSDCIRNSICSIHMLDHKGNVRITDGSIGCGNDLGARKVNQNVSAVRKAL